MPLARRLKKINPWNAIKKAIKGRARHKSATAPVVRRLLTASANLTELAYLPDALTVEHASPLRGAVESVTGADGIVGWLVDVTAPGKQCELELVADERVIASTETALYRDDLGLPAVPEARPGFRFTPGALVALLDEGAPPFARLAIRVARSNAYLPSVLPMLSQDIMKAAQAAAALEPDATFLDPLDFSLLSIGGDTSPARCSDGRSGLRRALSTAMSRSWRP